MSVLLSQAAAAPRRAARALGGAGSTEGHAGQGRFVPAAIRRQPSVEHFDIGPAGIRQPQRTAGRALGSCGRVPGHASPKGAPLDIDDQPLRSVQGPQNRAAKGTRFARRCKKQTPSQQGRCSRRRSLRPIGGSPWGASRCGRSGGGGAWRGTAPRTSSRVRPATT